MSEADAILEEQKAYYRARAPEYDNWWQRVGPYDRGEPNNRHWREQVALVRAELSDLVPLGRTLELAAGTGNWTAVLAELSEHVTAVDASPECLDINRTKLGPDVPVDYVLSDVFAYAPTEPFATVFFSFWLTHVPDDRFEHFWRLVDRWLAPEGTVFLLDNAHPQLSSTAPNSATSVVRTTASNHEGSVDLTTGQATRRLSNGDEFRIVKRFWRADELSARLAELGWRLDAHETDHFFLYGTARRSP